MEAFGSQRLQCMKNQQNKNITRLQIAVVSPESPEDSAV